MKTITISRRSKLLNQLLQQARHHQVILQVADGEQFLLTKITSQSTADVVSAGYIRAFEIGSHADFAEEVAQTQQNSDLMHFLAERASSTQPSTSIEELRKRLG
jgi:hypothetical protein